MRYLLRVIAAFAGAVAFAVTSVLLMRYVFHALDWRMDVWGVAGWMLFAIWFLRWAP